MTATGSVSKAAHSLCFQQQQQQQPGGVSWEAVPWLQADCPSLKQSTAYKSSFPQLLRFQVWGHVGFWTLFSHRGKTQTRGARPSLQTLKTKPLTVQMSWYSLIAARLFPGQQMIKIIKQRTSGLFSCLAGRLAGEKRWCCREVTSKIHSFDL